MIAMVLDTETTGLNKKYSKLNVPCSLRENGDEVVQVGGLILNESLEPVRMFCHYCDCLMPSVVPAAYEVNKLDLTTIRRYIPGMYLEEVCVKLIPEIFLDDLVIIGYNTSFDLRMVAQSMRNFCFDFENCGKVTTSFPTRGRWILDVMSYMPKRTKLVSHHDSLSGARSSFYAQWAGSLKIETNIPELLESSWQSAHNALFDAIETYLLFKERVWQKKLI